GGRDRCETESPLASYARCGEPFGAHPAEKTRVFRLERLNASTTSRPSGSRKNGARATAPRRVGGVYSPRTRGARDVPTAVFFVGAVPSDRSIDAPRPALVFLFF